MKPPFDITADMLDLCTEIGRLLGRYEGLNYPLPKPILRRRNRIRSIHGSLSIEGNTLSVAQVTALVDNKRVIGPQRDIIEVQNAILAYHDISSYTIYSARSLLRAHETMMKGLIPDPGRWRSANVGIIKGKHVAHVAPKAGLVPSLMNDLFTFLKQDNKTHYLIKAGIFHYELEFIHPFSDGNGRMGRLWQSVILAAHHPLFEYIPLESIIKEHQSRYYAALEESDRAGNSTAFIHFSLESIKAALSDFMRDLKPDPLDPNKRLLLFKTHHDKSPFSRKDYLAFFKTLSAPTASRDLTTGVRQGTLKKKGQKATTRYQFI